jgi:tetratricopeptide (TPR) repeat protein
MKKIIFISFIFILFESHGEETLFIKGNNEYNKENYSIAISYYDSILSNGLESSELFYNLGNCYFKKKDWASAIWNYEKSLKLNSTNQYALHNLKVTQTKLVDRIEFLPQIFYKNWWNQLISIFNLQSWQILTIIFVWIFLIINIMERFNYVNLRFLKTFLISLSIVSIVVTYSLIRKENSKNEAIIFASSVNVNSAPSKTSMNLFTLHSGIKIEIIDQIGEWINIKLANGNIGWIRKSECKIIN